MRDAKCQFSYWHPHIIKAGVLTARALIYDHGKNVYPGEDNSVLFGAVEMLCDKMKYPCLLRTGQTSGKHYWRKMCFIPNREAVAPHVRELIEFSAMADMLGLDASEWVVREYIPMHSAFTAFQGFPVSTERRIFVRNGKVECSHFYWPEEAFSTEHYFGDLLPDDYRERLAAMAVLSEGADEQLRRLSETVSQSLSGYWSIDWCLSESGLWYCIDMAEGDKSYHWPDCPLKDRP